MSDSEQHTITAIIHASCITGKQLMDAAASVKDLAMRFDATGRQTCSPRGLARISRFAWMLGARDKWCTDGMNFDQLCSVINTHILDHILPKCESRFVFLPDVTGDGWRADLGVQSPTKTQMARFTTWMTSVAVCGTVPYLEWAFLTSVINSRTERANWNAVGASTVHAWMQCMARDRKRLTRVCAKAVDRAVKQATVIQNAWCKKAYAAPDGSMFKRTMSNVEGMVG